MMRLELNRLERRLMDAESGKDANATIRHGGDSYICLRPREMRELLAYVERLEKALNSAEIDGKAIDSVERKVREAISSALSGVAYEAAYSASTALREIKLKTTEVIA